MRRPSRLSGASRRAARELISYSVPLAAARSAEVREPRIVFDELAAISDWRLHDIRRTVASGMARLKIALPVIEKVLNHRSGSFAGIVGVYQHHDFADEKRAALDGWARFVTTLVGEPAKNVLKFPA